MITLTLPDNNILQFEANVMGSEVALRIGQSLFKAALAIEVDGVIQDLDIELKEDAKIRIITAKDKAGLEILRHDTAHILAHAIKDLFPETQITIGPNIENGFYYDFARDIPFSTEDFPVIEKRMQEIIAQDIPIKREIWARNEAIKYFQKIGEHYKAELIQSFPEEEPISLYRQGDFIDLCRGPHSPSTGKSKAFKLLKLAGAYWRGDSRNPMLQRIYGTAWPTKNELEEYLTQLAEIERRDHRRLGKELDLFHIEDESSGMIFWHAKGWTLFRVLENYIRQKIMAHGYSEVRTPILLDSSLWQKSGHMDEFRENMFIIEEEKSMVLKPMNCPCHIRIFNQAIKSYRDLPLRMAEFGSCHRNEASGALHGLMRTRAFVQDDAHIFCTEDQIASETVNFCQLLKEVYNELGFTEILIRFSDRPEKRAGSDATWDKAEKALLVAIEAAELAYEMNPGEGAFYGPKLEFVLKDATGRLWQCGTLQVDFVLPERLSANYVAKDGNKYPPVMLHRAILGSLERFIGILIEQYAGWLPFWLAPIQVVIATISEEAADYAKEIYNQLTKEGLRCDLDISSEKINYKIRVHTLQKIPYILIMGKKEMEQRSVALRVFGKEQQNMSIAQLITTLIELQHLKGV